jgi:hypothetical protein
VTRADQSRGAQREWTDAGIRRGRSEARPGRGVFNPASSTVSAVVADGDELRAIVRRPRSPLDLAPLDAPPPAPPVENRTGTATLRNETGSRPASMSGGVSPASGHSEWRPRSRARRRAPQPPRPLPRHPDELGRVGSRRVHRTRAARDERHGARVLADHRTATRSARRSRSPARSATPRGSRRPSASMRARPGSTSSRRTTGMRPTATCGSRCRRRDRRVRRGIRDPGRVC